MHDPYFFPVFITIPRTQQLLHKSLQNESMNEQVEKEIHY